MSNLKQTSILFTTSGRWLAWYIVSLPSAGLIICIFLAMVTDPLGATATQCKVTNYLPSLSAAIGGGPPMTYIWRTCIALHVAPRLLLAVVYYQQFNLFPVSQNRRLYDLLNREQCCCAVLENLSLVGLTYISSHESQSLHEACYVMFIIFSQLYMLTVIGLFRWSRKSLPVTEIDRRSYRRKVLLASSNLLLFLAAMYFYYRHNAYCEPGVYSLFAILEYAVTFTNIAFHATVYGLDLGGVALTARDGDDRSTVTSTQPWTV